MKKLLLLSLLLSSSLFGANVLIRDLPTTIVLPASNTFVMFDGATQGTGKFNLATLPQITSTRSTLAALSVTNVSTGVSVQTLGGSSVADGSASLYYYNSTSTATPNGTSVIQPSVGSGRWLLVSQSGLPPPTISTLGGIFSKAPGSHLFLTGIGTDGTPAAAIPTISDIVGLGTMASQNSISVSIGGGSIDGVNIGQSTPGNGTFSNLVSSSALFGNAISLNSTGTSDLFVAMNNSGGSFGGFTWNVRASASTGQLGFYNGSTFPLRVSYAGVTTIDSLILTAPLPIASGGTAAATASGARTNLGVSATGGDTTYAFRTNNLSDLSSASSARANLGVSATGGDTTYAFRSNNLGDLASASTARTNLGLGSMAVQGASSVAITGGTASGLTVTASALNGTLGATTPSMIFATTIASNSNANIRTTKANFNLVVNVKDYGAIGDGTTDDTAAINAAISALTNYSTLLFPNGDYKITASLTTMAGLSFVTVRGEGARIHSTVTGAAGNTFAVTSSCSNISFENLKIVGSATVRGNGIHIRLYSSYSSVTNCYFSGCSDFAVHVSNDAGGYNIGTRVENNTFLAPLGDGIHVGNATDFVVSGNTLINTGDDAIGIIADSASFPPLRGNVFGNHIYNGGSDGIRIDEVNDLEVVGNDIHTTVQAGIEVNRFTSTTAYNNRIHIKSNKLYNTQTSSGPRGSIWVNFLNASSVTDNEIMNPANGAGIAFLDVNDLTIRGNTIYGAPVRAIASDDSTTSNVAATWSGLVIQSNVIDSVSANEAIYVVPASGKTITNLLVNGNVANQLPSGNWIYYARVTTGVISNNASRDNRTVANGGTVSGVNEYNNTLWPKLGIGTSPTANSDLIISRSLPGVTGQASVVVQGTLNPPAATDLHPNAYRDITIFNPTQPADGYASFEAQTSMGGSVNLNHFRGFQVRHGFTGSGTLGEMSGFMTANMGLSGTGTISFLRGLYVSNASISGGGTVGQFDGIYMDQLSNSTGLVNAIYIAGNNRVFMAGGQILTSALLSPIAGATTARISATFDQAGPQTGFAAMNSNSTGTGTMYGCYNNGGTFQGGIVQSSTTTVSFPTSSDVRLKENIRDLADSGTIIDAMRPVVFDWRWGGKNAHGFIAQELDHTYPEAVTRGDDGEEVTTPWSVDYSKPMPVVVAELQSLRRRDAELERRVAELEQSARNK